MRPRSIGPTSFHLIDWRVPCGKHYSGPGYSLPHIRWALGSPEHLILESRRRRFRLVWWLPRLRRVINGW